MRIASVSQILSVVDISEGGARLRGRIEETSSALDLTLWWPHLAASVTLRALVVRTDGVGEVAVRFVDPARAAELVGDLTERRLRRQGPPDAGRSAAVAI